MFHHTCNVQEKASVARHDIKHVSAWDFDDDDAKESSTLKGTKMLTHAMRKQHKSSRSQAAQMDRTYQRNRRHDQWDQEYDKGKVKKVKTSQKNNDMFSGLRGVGSFVNRNSSFGNRFDKASVAKTKAKKEGRLVESKKPTTFGNKKRKRREVSKGGRGSGSGGGGGGYNKLKMRKQGS